MQTVSNVRVRWVLSRLGLKRHWFIWVLCLSIFGLDLYNRLLPERASKNTSLQVEALQQEQYVPLLEADLLKVYTSKLSKHTETIDVEMLDTPIIPAVTPASNLGFWQDSEFSYQLLAVFKGLNTFAVLNRVEIESSESGFIEAKEGDSLGDFIVSSIQHNGLVLHGVDKKRIELVLFRPTVKVLYEDSELGEL